MYIRVTSLRGAVPASSAERGVPRARLPAGNELSSTSASAFPAATRRATTSPASRRRAAPRGAAAATLLRDHAAEALLLVEVVALRGGEHLAALEAAGDHLVRRQTEALVHAHRVPQQKVERHEHNQRSAERDALRGGGVAGPVRRAARAAAGGAAGATGGGAQPNMSLPKRPRGDVEADEAGEARARACTRPSCSVDRRVHAASPPASSRPGYRRSRAATSLRTAGSRDIAITVTLR